MIPLHIDWKDSTGAVIYEGGPYTGSSLEQNTLVLGVLAPNSYSGIFTVVLQNTALDRRLQIASQVGSVLDGAAETFLNIKLYLQSDPDTLNTLLNDWPLMNAGVEVSFDNGITWTRFSSSIGNPADSSTWLLLPGSAVAFGAPDGELDATPPTNRATLLIRVKTPANPEAYGLISFSLVPDFDVV